RNMGAWAFARGYITPMLGTGHVIGYAGRPESASPAPGLIKQHQREQADLIEQAFAAPTVARRPRKKLVRRKKAREGRASALHECLRYMTSNARRGRDLRSSSAYS